MRLLSWLVYNTIYARRSAFGGVTVPVRRTWFDRLIDFQGVAQRGRVGYRCKQSGAGGGRTDERTHARTLARSLAWTTVPTIL